MYAQYPYTYSGDNFTISVDDTFGFRYSRWLQYSDPFCESYTEIPKSGADWFAGG